MCQHSGYHTPEGRYDHDAGMLRFVAVCDDCGQPIRELLSERYRPTPAYSSSSSAARKRSFSARVP